MATTITILGLVTPICRIRMVHITGHLAVRRHSPIWHHHTTRIVFIWTLTMEYGIVRMMKRNPSLVAVSMRLDPHLHQQRPLHRLLMHHPSYQHMHHLSAVLLDGRSITIIAISSMWLMSLAGLPVNQNAQISVHRCSVFLIMTLTHGSLIS